MTELRTALWLDNDPGYIVGFVRALEREGFAVNVARSVTEAEVALKERAYDLLIIDVMIPVTPAEHAAGYTGTSTDDSHKTGLEFYKRRAKALEKSCVVLVLTVRVDKAIRDEFLEEGLRADRFLTKLELPDAKSFVQEIKRQLRRTS